MFLYIFPAGQVIQKCNIYGSNYAGAWYAAQYYHILMKVSRYDRKKRVTLDSTLDLGFHMHT